MKHKYAVSGFGGEQVSVKCERCGKTVTHTIGQPAPEGCTGQPWRKWRISKSFLKTLHDVVGNFDFTNHTAYLLYMEHHSLNTEKYRRWLAKHKAEAPSELRDHMIEMYRKQIEVGDEWDQATVRNHLSAAATRGLLIRLGPGHYQFPRE